MPPYAASFFAIDGHAYFRFHAPVATALLPRCCHAIAALFMRAMALMLPLPMPLMLQRAPWLMLRPHDTLLPRTPCRDGC